MRNSSIVLQVRLRSTRLPNKLLLPLKDGTIFEHILRRLGAAEIPSRIVVATTSDTAPFISRTADRHGVPIVVGSEQDVLSRFVKAIRAFHIDNVVRATGDNPLVSIEYIDKALLLHSEKQADLTAFPLLPYGTGIEVVRAEALEDVAKKAKDPLQREHITQYIYNHDSDYTVVFGLPEPALQRPEIRLTVDTREDYLYVRDIYDALYKGEPILLKEVIHYIDNHMRS